MPCACGVYLADSVSYVYAENLQGFGESLDIVAINDAILERSGGSWRQPPAELRLDQETLDRMKHALAKLQEHPVCAWKDSRTALTFPLWKPLLAGYRIVVCFRHPAAVARSLLVRNSLPLEEGYRLWATYNERVLAFVENERRVMWFDFDRTPDDMYPWLWGICRELGIELLPEALSIFNRFQRHHQGDEMPGEPRIVDLYQRLQSCAQQAADLLARPPTSPVSAIAKDHPADAAIESLRRDIAALADIEKKHNSLLQTANGTLNSFRQDISVLADIENKHDLLLRTHQRELLRVDEHCRQLDRHLEDLQATLAQCERQLVTIVESRAWKSYQWLRRHRRRAGRLCMAIVRSLLSSAAAAATPDAGGYHFANVR